MNAENADNFFALFLKNPRSSAFVSVPFYNCQVGSFFLEIR